jgi:hypothetical protein
MKHWPLYLALGIIVFAVVLAVFIGDRLSEQTLAFMSGVIFGSLVGLPVGAGLFWMMRGSRQPDRIYQPPQPAVIMTPPAYASISPAGLSHAQAYPAAQPVVARPVNTQREFTTIGEDEELIYYEPDPVR